MNPSLKALHRQVQREFFKNRQSKKWKTLKGKFRRKKQKAIKLFYSRFVNDLKQSDPGSWYKMAKRIGAVDQMNEQDLIVDELKGLDNQQSADIIADLKILMLKKRLIPHQPVHQFHNHQNKSQQSKPPGKHHQLHLLLNDHLFRLPQQPNQEGNPNLLFFKNQESCM